MIQPTQFRQKQDREEIFREEESLLPLRCLSVEANSFIHGEFPWHWHKALEIDYVRRGSVEFQTPEGRYPVEEGSAIFLNSGKIHSFRTPHPERCRIETLIFSPELLTTGWGDGLFQRYLSPVLESSVSAAVFSREREADRPLIARVEAALALEMEEPFGYELTLRGVLGDFWLLLLKSRDWAAGTVSEARGDTRRFKQFLSCIHSRYAQPLTLREIAAAGSVGERECSRCFQRCIGKSPVEYLNHFRVQMAAQLLLQSEESVTSISEQCGFSSLSYFGKVFRQQMGCSPREYRKRRTGTDSSCGGRITMVQ